MVELMNQSWGFNSIFNQGGLSHLTVPFFFNLTLCGLPVFRLGRTMQRHRSNYDSCKWCLRVANAN